MKKQLITLLLLPFFTASFAQSAYVGNWLGSLNVGVKLRVVFHVKKEGDKYTGTMDSPDQKVFGIECSSVGLKGDSLVIEIEKIRGQYIGKLLDTSRISGTFTQAGTAFPMELAKVYKEVEPLKRPQSPVPPFAYKSEDVVYHNTNGSIQYGATVTTPNGKGPFPALLLITGSGQQNRDEEILGHRPFAVIADYLTKKGYIVMRVDDRGMGQSTGDVIHSTSADFAEDVKTSLDYLEKIKAVNLKKVGLLGHSEGGMIAEMVATERKDVSFIVSLSGPGVKLSQGMHEQNTQYLESMGLEKSTVETYIVLYDELVQEAIIAKDSAQCMRMATASVKKWRAKTAVDIVASTTGINDDASEKKYIDVMVAQLYSPWFRYFIAYNPAPVIEKLHCKVLAMNGDKDIQVISKSNLQGWRDALAKSKSPKYDVKEMKGMNHLFQTCKACTVSEYADIETTMEPEALQTISDWWMGM